MKKGSQTVEAKGDLTVNVSPDMREEIIEEFNKAEALIGTLQHVYYFTTGEEMKCSHVSALLAMVEDHMEKLEILLEKLFTKEARNDNGRN